MNNVDKQGAAELVRFSQVSKSFGGSIAVDGVDLSISAGEVHILLGENGAGKSTLIKMLAGVHQPDSGAVFIDGVETKISDTHHAHRLGIATIHQEFNLIPELSVAENILLGRQPGRWGFLSRRRRRALVLPLLERVGLDIDPETPIKGLGIARQQLVEIAKALSLDARVLILDEPTAALTDQEVDRLFDVMRGLRSDGVGQVYISHRLAEVGVIGDRVTVMRDGRKVAELAANAGEDEFVKAMVGRSIDAQYPRRRVGAQPHAEPILSVRGLTRPGWFDDVSFEVMPGEVVGIAGLVGAGRTELVRCLTGAERYLRGEVSVRGRALPKGSVRVAARAGVGHVPEDRKTQGLILGADVRANLSAATMDRYSLAGFVRDGQLRRETADVAERLRVRMRTIRQTVGTLSGGNQQKIVFGKWVLAGATVLFLDEPTRGVDVGARVEIYELINDITAAGGAVVMVSSDLPEVIGMSDRVLVMASGRLSGELSHAEATQEAVMALAVKEVESSRVH